MDKFKRKQPTGADEHIASVIVRLWDRQPGEHFCISTKDERERWRDHFFERQEFDDVVEFIHEHEDCDVYFCPHGFSEPKRKKEFAVPPRVLYADLDEADPHLLKVTPSIAFESSPGRFVGLWIMDKEVTEELNRRLSYSIGADKSGWDFTQVLRVPGTRNYKYSSEPEVTLLWEKWRPYKLKELERMLPHLPGSKHREHVSIDSTKHVGKAVIRKFAMKLPKSVKQLIDDKKVEESDRSKCIYKIVAGLHDAGASADQIAAVLKGNVYFVDKHGDDERKLEAEINRCLGKLSNSTKARAENTGGLSIITARELQEKDFPELNFVVEGYVAEGLTMLGGKPKMGKSFMCMALAYAIASGGVALGSIKCKKGAVLYAALEDNERRLQRRIIQLFGSERRWPSNLQFTTELSRLNEGGLEEIEDWIIENDGVAVFIDTLIHVRPVGKSDTNYETDYAALTPLQELAGRYGVAIVVVHHLRKMAGDDPLDTISGTTGLTGAVDSVLVLTRSSNGTILQGRGRDLEQDIEVALDFEDGHWKLLGDAADVHRSDQRKAILGVLAEATDPMSPAEIAAVLGEPPDNVRQRLFHMTKDGEVKKQKRGEYVIADKP
jgi:hypothetical protein